MSVLRASAFAPVCLLTSLAWLGCSSSTPGTLPVTGDTSGGQGGSGPGVAGGGATGTAGTNAVGGSGAAGAAAAGAGGAVAGTAGGGGVSQGGASAGGTAGANSGDQLPWRPLNVTAPPAVYDHKGIDSKGNEAGVDTRAAKMAGKLVISLAVNQGGYLSYLGKRGFHVMGVLQVPKPGEDPSCHLAPGVPTPGPDYVGNCRLNTLDGMPHGDQSTVTVADSIITQVTTNLVALQAKYAGEDWGYFLNQDGTVRWSDVAWTGYSHGATSAVLFAFTLHSYRGVAMSGPRDNVCGDGVATGQFDPTNPPYKANCPDTDVATWLRTLTPATPLDRIYAFVGMNDSEYGDIQYAMNRLNLIGAPVNISTGTTPYGGSHRFYANTGHVDFSSGFDDAINVAFGVLPENAHPTF